MSELRLYVQGNAAEPALLQAHLQAGEGGDSPILEG